MGAQVVFAVYIGRSRVKFQCRRSRVNHEFLGGGIDHSALRVLFSVQADIGVGCRAVGYADGNPVSSRSQRKSRDAVRGISDAGADFFGPVSGCSQSSSRRSSLREHGEPAGGALIRVSAGLIAGSVGYQTPGVGDAVILFNHGFNGVDPVSIFRDSLDLELIHVKVILIQGVLQVGKLYRRQAEIPDKGVHIGQRGSFRVIISGNGYRIRSVSGQQVKVRLGEGQGPGLGNHLGGRIGTRGS